MTHENLWSLQGEHAACKETISRFKGKQVGCPENRKQVIRAAHRMLAVEAEVAKHGLVLR